ncbi:NADH-quinone oxidoreductase subunit N [Kineococcus sp. LSe6-4]|uniref:NADH-quinone oxidoreductase subunit N n=1 Tax=Kineococcus halophytocola TaxID=3234027 RepID=A0ABV4H2T4_9ACTN
MGKAPLELLPEICLLLGALATLLLGSFLPRQRQGVARLVAVVALVACAVTGALALGGPAHTVYAHTYAVDDATGAVRLVVVVATLLVLALSAGEVSGTPRESETYCLLLLSALGTVVLAGADDLLVLAVAFLLASVPLYGLIGTARTGAAAEAVLKTYLLGALTNVLLLLGVALLAALAGATTHADLAGALAGAPAAPVAVGVVAVLAGLLFKAGAVPAHAWVPDAAQGASATAAAFATTVPKIGALVAAYRLLDALPRSGPAALDWPLLVAVLAAASMTLGNLAAFGQDDPRRLLGWSTVSQVGYLLMPVAVAGRAGSALPALLLYVAGYAVSNLGAFAVTAALPGRRTLASYRGLARRRPVLAGALLVCLLGLVGTPPTAVFAGKVAAFTVAWDGGLAWLVVVAALNTVASLFYYLRWIAPVFRTEAHPAADAGSPAGADPREGAGPARGSALVAAVLALVLGVVLVPLAGLLGSPPVR